MKNKYIFYSSYISYITVFISFIAFQIFCSILIQPIQLSAQLSAQLQNCRYITPIGVKRFTREEQRRHGFNSGQNLLCYATVQDCLPINHGSDVIPLNEASVMCDVGPCTYGGCMCPTDPRECFRDNIDGRNRYRNGVRMVRVDNNISCQNIGPMRAKIFTREEQRRHGFNIGDTHLCYANVRNCSVNGIPVNTDIFICDIAGYNCSTGIASGKLCPCPTNLNECAKDTLDGHNNYIGGTETIQADEEPSNPRRQRRPRRGGRE